MTRYLFFLIFAFHNLVSQNNLIVFSGEGDRFYLVLNGLKYNEQAQTHVKVVNLDQPMYVTKIIFEDPNLIPVDAKVYLMWEGKNVSGAEFTYSIVKNKKGRHTLRFISNTLMSKEPDPLVPPVPVASPTLPVMEKRNYGNVYYTYKGTRELNNNIPAGGCTQAMSLEDFKIAFDLIEITPSGDRQLKIAEDIVKSNCVSSDQVIAFLDVLSFELDKVKLAKTAYPSLVDKQKASAVAEALNFPASKEDYLKFIGAVKSSEAPVATKNNSIAVSCTTAMTSAAFETAIASIKKRAVESQKMAVGSQVISENCFTSAQVKSLMEIFSLESSRVEIAKTAYAKTLDKNNYFVVNNAFKFSASVEDLNSFIKKQ